MAVRKVTSAVSRSITVTRLARSRTTFLALTDSRNFQVAKRSLRIALDALDVYEPLAHEMQQHVKDTLNLAIYRFRIAHKLQAPG